MADGSAMNRNARQWGSILFFAAGGFLLIDVAFLWIRFFSDFRLSILWAAAPGIMAFAASVLGLLTLYSRISLETPLIARCGAGFALAAITALCIAAFWIIWVSIFSNGISESPPNGVLALAGIFLVSMIIAFICYAVAFLLSGSPQNIGYLLAVPVAAWSVMLVVGMIKGLEAGLSLDLYTNALIAAAFLSIGFILQK